MAAPQGGRGPDDCRVALATLFDVMLTVCLVMAPFTPFLTETMYQTLRKRLPARAPESVHFCDFPPEAKVRCFVDLASSCLCVDYLNKYHIVS